MCHKKKIQPPPKPKVVKPKNLNKKITKKNSKKPVQDLFNYNYEEEDINKKGGVSNIFGNDNKGNNEATSIFD